MSLNEQIFEKIDLYLTGKLSPIEKTQFETEIASNPELNNEVSFQKDVIESIKQSRGLELKSRLQSIEVSSKSKWFSKNFLGGAAAAAVISVLSLVYYNYSKNNDNPNIEAVNQNVVMDYVPISKLNPETAQNVNESNIVEITNENINNSPVVQSPATTTGDINYDNVNAPQIDVNTEEGSTITSNPLAAVDDLESVEIMKGGDVEIDVEFKNPNSKELAYKFYDQKLYLYGKFNTKNPYEVIEINTKFGKEFYLKFDKSYYTIQNGKVDKTLLEKVDNSKLIDKLNQLN